MKAENKEQLEVKDVKENGIPTFKTGWENIPLLADIKSNIFNASNINKSYLTEIEKGLDTLKGELPIGIKNRMRPNQSKNSPKVAKAQAESMYPKISEPFHSASSLYSITATNPLSVEYSQQAEDIINFHFKHNINRRFLVDQAAKQFYDHGVLFGKVTWEVEEVEELVTEIVPYTDLDGNITGYKEEESKQTYLTKNKPSLTICPYNSVIVDPSCKGDLSKAKFIAHVYTTCKADLIKDERYQNLDSINFDTPLDGVEAMLGDSNESTDYLNNMDSMQFKDDARRLFTVTEYWGMYDIDGSGILVPIVMAYVGDVVIRLSQSPMPDNKLPFVSAVYLVEEFTVYGSSNNTLLREDQQIVGNVSRALIDQVSDRMTKRTIIHPNMFKSSVQKKNYLNGIPSESSGTIDPRLGIFELQNEKPIDMNLVNILQLTKANIQEATGVSSIGINNTNFTSSNEVSAYVDSASNRESSVLGRFARFWVEVGEKFLAMSLSWMEADEIIAITGRDLVDYPYELPRTISPYFMEVQVLTEGVKRAKISKLLEILQFVKDSPDPKIVGSIVRKICLLDDSPDLAQTIYDIITAPPPEPTQHEIMMMQLQLEEARYKVEVLKYTAMDLMATAQLKDSRVGTEESKQQLTYAKADDIKDKLYDKSTGLDLAKERAREELLTQAELTRKKIISDISVQEDAQKKANELLLNASLDPNKRSTI